MTVTAHCFETPLPSFAVAVIVADPAATPVTTPELETVATDVLELDQVTLVLLAVEGLTVAVSVSFWPV